MQTDNIQNEDDLMDLGQFMGAHLKEFQPLAYFDKHLDCIRVLIADCSVTEHRLSKYITIIEANHSDMSKTVGFTIKGIRHLFEKLGLELTGVMRLTVLMDSIIKVYPHSATKAVEEFVASNAKDLEIDFSSEAVAA